MFTLRSFNLHIPLGHFLQNMHNRITFPSRILISALPPLVPFVHKYNACIETLSPSAASPVSPEPFAYSAFIRELFIFNILKDCYGELTFARLLFTGFLNFFGICYFSHFNPPFICVLRSCLCIADSLQ